MSVRAVVALGFAASIAVVNGYQTGSGMSKAAVDAYIKGVKAEVDKIAAARTGSEPVSKEPVSTLTAENLKVVVETPKLMKGLGGTILDEKALLAKSTFPIAPPDLIQKAQEFLLVAGAGTVDPSTLDSSFEFCAPFVGPLPRAEYTAALESFDLLNAFPDMENNYHAFRVDPFETNRVWFDVRPVATHTGNLMGLEPTGKKLELPPQTQSIAFTEEGLVKEFTVGYVTNRRAGNTGGLGGAFGFFYGVGRPLPIPECQPYKPSKRFRLLNFVGKVAKSEFVGKMAQKTKLVGSKVYGKVKGLAKKAE